MPLRPIVSYVGSPTYALSKYLVTIISPVVGNSDHHLRNSKEWTNLVKRLILNDNEELVSFDVVALFTSIPTSIAVEAAKARLDRDSNLEDRTTLTSTDIASLMSFCLKATEFSFKGNYYKQIHGTAMGSPISVVVANLVMEVLEEKALQSFIHPPRIYKRYVDDTICVIRRDLIDEFHQHLNSQDSDIKFTVERYADDGLPFLDTLNKIKEDGSIDVSIFRKKTHTDRYLQFSSHHPPQHKAAVVRTLFHRSEELLSIEKNKDEERIHLKRALQDNGYPRQFVRKYNKQRSKKEQRPDEEVKGYVTLPYVQGTTERIQRVLASYGIKVSVRPTYTLKNILSNVKDPLPKEKKVGVIYSIPCGECDTIYIGETKRAMGTRVKEHQACVRLQKTESSALSEHAHKCGHSIAWDNAKILQNEGRWHQRKWAEACYISKNKSAIFNRDAGRKLPENYLAIVKGN